MNRTDYLYTLLESYTKDLQRLGSTKEISVSTGDLSLILECLKESISDNSTNESFNTDDIEACFDCSLPIFVKSDRQHIFFKGGIYAVCDSCWTKQRNSNLLEYQQLSHYRQFVKDNNYEEQFERYMQNNL